MMPDKSGMEVLRDVRERDRHTPIFMITAYGTRGSRGSGGETRAPTIISPSPGTTKSC